MITLRQDPYLWWHVAGIATVPLWLDGCFAGLAVGDPAIFIWVELGLLILVGTLPVLGLQWFRPFYLFRVGPLALSPDALTASQSRLLTLQHSWLQKGVALCVGLGLAGGLVTLYRVAPISASTTPFAGIGRASGWGLCAVCFCLANWFGQTSISALGLLLARDRTLERTHTYEMAAIAQDFSGVAIRVGQIFPRHWLEIGDSASVPLPEPVAAPSADTVLANAAHPEPETTDLPMESDDIERIETTIEASQNEDDGGNDQHVSSPSDPEQAELSDQDAAVLSSQTEAGDIDTDDHPTAPITDHPSPD